MTARRFCLSIFLVVLSSNAAASDPAQSIAAARAAIDAREYQRASTILQEAIPGTLNITDPKQRESALGAIHFYRALALAMMGNDGGARVELREFFQLHPGRSTLDRSRYPARFVDLFDEENGRHAPRTAHATAFDEHYPGFDTIGNVGSSDVPIESWGMTADYQLLATDSERDKWQELRDDAARSAFIASFWRRRDPDPLTERNEWREEFNRRVAFADSIFGLEGLHGSLSDRGRVFVLLGKPAQVYREPIPYRFGMYQGLNGTYERWVFFREQLPTPLPVHEIDFKFVDQPGYGDHAMLREPMPLQALAGAQTAAPKTAKR